ncbi:MAG: hypothetical protein LBD32_01910 [Cytophagales bacterium]|jgi:hypothetical protein|nr:hypothetical protein [Cytophagales bacterium]
MISLKWNSISFHFINFYFILFPFFFLSCGDNLKNGNSKKSFRDIYAELKDKNSLYPRDKVEAACWHGRFLEACHNETEFFTFINEKIEKKDMPFVSSLRDGMLSFFNKNECSYVPESGVVKEVYQICLIPGFLFEQLTPIRP